MPERIQRQRIKGWRAPEGAVYVGRPSKWRNPHMWSGKHDVFRRHRLVEAFEASLRAGLLGITVDDVRRELAGKTLMCWCPVGSPCHGDVLFEIANEEGGGA